MKVDGSSSGDSSGGMTFGGTGVGSVCQLEGAGRGLSPDNHGPFTGRKFRNLPPHPFPSLLLWVSTGTIAQATSNVPINKCSTPGTLPSS